MKIELKDRQGHAGASSFCMKKLEIVAEISHFTHATVCMERTFVNCSGKEIEAIYSFYIPEGWSPSPVYSLEAQMIPPGGETHSLVAVAMDKESAKEAYKKAKSESRAAGLMVKASASEYRVSLGKIGVGWTVKTTLKYIEELVIEACDGPQSNNVNVRLKLVQAAHVAKDHGTKMALRGMRPARDISHIRVAVSIGGPLHGFGTMGFASPRGKREFVACTEIDKFDLSYHHMVASKPISLAQDTDFVMCVRSPPTWLWSMEVDKARSEVTNVISLQPHLATSSERHIPARTEIYIVVDRSGSMRKTRMGLAKCAISLLLQSLDPKDEIWFNVLSFGSRYEYLFKRGCEPLDEHHLRMAKSHVNGMASNMGGTNILGPIRDLLERKIREGFSRQVFFITDGEGEKTNAVIELVRKCARADGTRFFTFGIGNNINPVLLDMVASSSFGRSCFITNEDTIHSHVMKQLKFALQPALTSVLVEFDDECTEPVIQPRTTVFNMQNAVGYWKSSNLKSVSKLALRGILVSYCFDGENHEERLSPLVVLAHEGWSNATPLAILAANAKIAETSMYYSISNSSEMDLAKREAVALGIRYNLATRFTSLVMVDDMRHSEGVTGRTEHLQGVRYCEWDSDDDEETNESGFRFPSKPNPTYDHSDDDSDDIEECPFGFSNKPNPPRNSQSEWGGLVCESAFGRVASSSSTVATAIQVEAETGGVEASKGEASKGEASKGEASKGAVYDLLMETNIDGLWEWSECVAQFLGLTMDEAKSVPCPVGIEVSLWVTALVLSQLQRCWTAEKSTWQLIASKAVRTLKGELAGDQFSAIMSIAESLVSNTEKRQGIA